MDNPESLLRKPRKTRKLEGIEQQEGQRAEHEPEIGKRHSLDNYLTDVNNRLAEQHKRTNHHFDALSFYEELPESLVDKDPEQTFNRKWGYLPPLDEEAAAIIAAIIANPEMAKTYTRLGPDNADFVDGLGHRNVFLRESCNPDSQMDHITRLVPGDPAETDREKESHSRLWALDQAKCDRGSNEALFQRTLMMSLIARHFLIYTRDTTSQCLLDFSVEESWSCPPMPTRAYRKLTSFLTQPKPDLAVCFNREALIDEIQWNNMPKATKRLACYENGDVISRTRVFHFFTIEAKKAKTAVDDSIGLNQSLNNASQALHNMYEFFKDAGPQHEEIFFAKVRFFSVVASTEGLVIRIHRATRVPVDGPENAFIIPDYPLRFEFREFRRISSNKLDRKTTIETLGKILIGYGVGELHTLLRDAATALTERFSNDIRAMQMREDQDFYRYGQIINLSSRRPTPAVSQTPSLRTNMSPGYLQSGMTTKAPSPNQSGMNSFSNVPRNSGKRRRESSASARRGRPRK